MSDKPAHILEIPDSLGRDVDRAREGRAPAPPMEAFMSDAALEQVEAQTAQAAQAVRAENLVPISAAEAAARTTFDGSSMPALPKTRRVIPAPFRRESVSINHHGRAWQSCAAEDVQAGDTVPGVGRVVSTELVRRFETVAGVPDVTTGMKVILTGQGGIRASFDPWEQVQAHRRAE